MADVTMVLVNAYGDPIRHKDLVRLGPITMWALQTARGLAFKVDPAAGSAYWLNVDAGVILAPGRHRLGLAAEVVPVGAVATNAGVVVRCATPAPALDDLLDHDIYWALRAEQEQEGYPFMVGYGMPIKIFLGNLYMHGFAVSVGDAGELIVKPPAGYAMPPAFVAEISKRKALLLDVLLPMPPADLAPYFGRLINDDECDAAEAVAVQLGIALDVSPVNGRYLLAVKREEIGS